jgi:hypothetical protein
MGLPARQRRVLDRIESRLRGSDPRLAALYAIFARLNRDEEMPRIEQLRNSMIVLSLRVRLALRSFFGRLFGRLVPKHRAVIFFPLALVLATVGIVFAARATSGNSCQPTRAEAGHNATAKQCKNQYMMGIYPGRLGVVRTRSRRVPAAGTESCRRCQSMVPVRRRSSAM